MKILKGESAVCSSGKRSVVVSTANKEHNLSKSSCEQLRSTAEAVRGEKKKRKSNVEKVLQHVCAPFIFYLSFVPFISQQGVLFIPCHTAGNKNECVKGPAAAAASARKHKENTTKRDCQNQIGNTLAWQNPHLRCE